MDNKNNTSSPQLCAAGCGFYGNPLFNDMCSKCFKEKNKDTSNEPGGTTSTTVSTSDVVESSQISSSNNNNRTITNTSTSTSSSSNSSQSSGKKRALEDVPAQRKHARPASISEELTAHVPSPQPDAPSSLPATIPNTPEAGTPSSSSDPADKPVQANKGRCFKCRVKVPLAKQTINKCRCNYVFCDSHRYPDRHDCDIDYAKIGRDLLAKNNPKLHERPKGGRSFKRIDSL